MTRVYSRTDVRTALLDVARTGGLRVVLDGRLARGTEMRLRNVQPAQALQALAATVRATVETRSGGVWLVRAEPARGHRDGGAEGAAAPADGAAAAGPSQVASGPDIACDFRDTDVAKVVATLRRIAPVPIELRDGVAGKVTLQVRAPRRVALERLA